MKRHSRDSLLARVRVLANGCWEFLGTINRGGYGWISYHGQHMAAHQAFYREFVGPIPQGMELDHTCHTRACGRSDRDCPHRRCCNPEHLQAVSHAENTARGLSGACQAGRSQCPQGHPYDSENTWIDPKTGKRHCRACGRQRTGERDRRLAEAEGRELGLDNRLKTHCKHGHEFTPENTYHPPGRPNKRGCRTCLREAGQRRRAA